MARHLLRNRAACDGESRISSLARTVCTRNVGQFDLRCLLGRSGMSTVAVGTQYEQDIIQLLHAMGARVSSTGGAGDRGLDFVGEWAMTPAGLAAGHGPHHQIRLLLAQSSGSCTVPVVGQCKATSTPVGTSTMRDFQHAMQGTPATCLGVLACTAGFAWRDLAAQPGLIARHTVLMHVDKGRVLRATTLLTARTGPAAAFPAPPLLMQPNMAQIAQGMRTRGKAGQLT